jgi:hypothetical protein
MVPNLWGLSGSRVTNSVPTSSHLSEGLIACYLQREGFDCSLTVPDRVQKGAPEGTIQGWPLQGVGRVPGEPWMAGGFWRHVSGGDTLKLPGGIWTYWGTGPWSIAFWIRSYSFANLSSVFETASNHFSFTIGTGAATAGSCRVWYNGVSTGAMALAPEMIAHETYFCVITVTAAGAVKVYLDGVQAASGTAAPGAIGGFSEQFRFADNSSGGKNRHTGQIGDVFLWSVALDAALVHALYVEADNGYPTLFPQGQTYGSVSGAISSDGTGTAPTPGTITLSSATLSASTPDQGPPAYLLDAIALSNPAATGSAPLDATGTAEPPDITLTAPTATAGESQSPEADPPDDITLTAPTLLTTSQGSAVPGTIVLSVPTARGRPNYVYAPQPSYRGRFLRGGTLPITLTFTELPTSAPTARIFRGTTLIEAVQIPVVDEDRRVFGLDKFLGTEYLDGNYVIVYLYDVEGNNQWSVEYFDVLGGTGRTPVTAAVEQKRPLGRAVLYFDDEGVGRIGYNARVDA